MGAFSELDSLVDKRAIKTSTKFLHTVNERWRLIVSRGSVPPGESRRTCYNWLITFRAGNTNLGIPNRSHLWNTSSSLQQRVSLVISMRLCSKYRLIPLRDCRSIIYIQFSYFSYHKVYYLYIELRQINVNTQMMSVEKQYQDSKLHNVISRQVSQVTGVGIGGSS